MSLSLRDTAILKFKDTSYRCIITGLSKSEAINVVQSIDSTERSGT